MIGVLKARGGGVSREEKKRTSSHTSSIKNAKSAFVKKVYLIDKYERCQMRQAH